MQALNRRECMKHVLAGLTAISAGGFPLAALGKQAESQAQGKSGGSAEEFWKQVEQAKASALAHSAVNAARAGVQAQREVNASKRAAALLGGEAGKEHMARAEKLYQTRTAQLQKTKQALAEFGRANGEAGETKFKEFLDKGGLKEALEHARQATIQGLLRSEISPEEAEKARKTLDERIEKVQGMKSFKELSGYLDHHLDELLEQKMSQEDPNPLCLFILLITSLYLILLILSILICVLLLGLVPCDQIFNQMLAQTCP